MLVLVRAFYCAQHSFLKGQNAFFKQVDTSVWNRYTKSNNNIMTENIFFSCRLHLRCTTLDSISILRKSEFGKIKIDKLFWLLVSNKRRRSHNPLKVKDHSVHQTNFVCGPADLRGTCNKSNFER